MIGHSKMVVYIGLISLFLISTISPILPPPGAMGPYLNGTFSEITPGFGGSWYLEETLTEIEIIAPLKIVDFPNSEDVLVLCKTGQLWRINTTTQSQELVLDISDRSYNFGETGSVSLALHPEFGNPAQEDKQVVFIFYRLNPDPTLSKELGYNRLSKFVWDEGLQKFQESSEEILIQQYDRSSWHNGGGMFFHEGLLYLALGDEGDVNHQIVSNQVLDRGLFSGLIRIDVDNNPNRSHPIRRQPISNEPPPAGWPTETFTTGYSIPNDNPWQSESGEILEEFFAIGVRSPYSTHFDKEAEEIWIGDVGSTKREEINLVEKGDNLQWNYLEGESWAGSRPDVIIGNEKKPVFHYGDELGGCIIGGGVYRGDKFPYLQGRYLFSDYRSNNFMVLKQENNSLPEAEVLLSNFGPEPLDLKNGSTVSGIHFLSNGDILVSVIAWPFTSAGKLLHLRQRDAIPDPPARLSELDVFTDLENLEVIEGIIPYQVNAPLWSDHAVKKRWMAIPNDGEIDQPEEQIQFSSNEDWGFPEGTVFIKHFDLPTSTSDPTQVTKLETRFFIMAKNNTAYGLTYKWNEDQTDAYLQLGNSEGEYDIWEDGEMVTQTWQFPSRNQCMSCHNSNANFVLGVKTHQLNSELYYPELGFEKNQLEYLSDNNIIPPLQNNASTYPIAYNIQHESASLDERIRSYLDANCSSCHRLGGVSDITMDLRFHTPLELKNIISLPTLSQSSNHSNLIVEPGNHQGSELWIRDQSEDENQMPPLAKNLVDHEYVEALAEWIDGLIDQSEPIENFVAFPNPSEGWMILRTNPDWELPIDIEVFSTDGRLLHSERHYFHHMHLGLQRVGYGTFLLNVKDASGNSHTKPIVVYGG